MSRYLDRVLFERSEFLMDTSQKKICLRVRLILALVWGRQTVYGQNTVYLCLSKHIVFENTLTLRIVRVTTAASETEGVPGVSWMESWTRLACRRPGPGAHTDIERGKVPSAARVACIARSACTSLVQNSNEAGSSGLYCLERAP